MYVTLVFFFFFNDTATTEIYTLSLHDALPISRPADRCRAAGRRPTSAGRCAAGRRGRGGSLTEPLQCLGVPRQFLVEDAVRSEEHTSELQSRQYLVCRLLLEKKKKNLASAYYG